MRATAAKKQKPLERHPSKLKKMSAYAILAIILISIMAVLFAFPLYWIITGSFKTGAAINATTPEWWPSQWVLTNYQKLFAGKRAPLWQLAVPFGSKFSANGEPVYFSVGPMAPAAIRWMINTVFMAVMSMILTCLTAAMAGYALAKKRFVGRKLLFTLIVCAMALPKQVILIPLLREMSALNLYNTIWAVIFPIVGWPFGVFLMKQFSEGIPTEMLEAARIDGASEARTFVKIVLPMVKPGIGALAIFTFINSWNDYFMQLIMLSSTSNLTISLGIAKLQAENSTDFGLIMAGAALAAVPIIIIFLIFQKYFTKGIAMDFGEWELKSYKELSTDIRFRDSYQAWIDSGGTLACPNGESRKEFCKRSICGFERALTQALELKRAMPDKEIQIVFFVHGGTIMAIMSHYCDMDYYDYQVKNGCGYSCEVAVEGNEIVFNEIVPISL